jgi:hypothetical protein
VIAGSPPRAPVAAGDLCLLFELGALLCAIPAERVHRLLLADEAQVIVGDPRGGTGDWLVVSAEGRKYAARDLGELLESPSTGQAWVLVDVGTGRGAAPIALRTGPCLRVERLPAVVPLPRGLFRHRARAFPAVFPLTGVSRGEAANETVGVVLDPLALFSAEELGAAAAAAHADRSAAEPARARP